MMISLSHYLVVSALVFALGIGGILFNRRNIIVFLMCIELILLAVSTNFIAFSEYMGNIHGEIVVFFVLTVAAAEAAIGLAILVVLYRNRGTIQVDSLNTLKA